MPEAMLETVKKYKYCVARINRLIKILEDGNSITCACRASGISRETFYRWMTEHAGFRKKVEKARAQAEQDWVNILKFQSVKNVAATIFALKAQFGWKEVQTIEHSIAEAPKRTDEWGNELPAIQPGGGNNGHNRLETKES